MDQGYGQQQGGYAQQGYSDQQQGFGQQPGQQLPGAPVTRPYVDPNAAGNSTGETSYYNGLLKCRITTVCAFEKEHL